MSTVFRRIVAAALLIVLSPFLLLIAVAIPLDSPGPVFFRQQRVGRDGQPFMLFKFRSMYHRSGRLLDRIGPGDARVTRVGRLIRATHLDELPQLWNILCGEMSFIGPRPSPAEWVRLHAQIFPGYSQRFSVLPGLTGPAQIYPRSWQAEHRAKVVSFDIAYAAKRANGRDFVLDLYILWRTFLAVFRGQGV